MLVGTTVRRVAICGGLRIPFARSMGAYAESSNQDMLTYVFKSMVERYRLANVRLGDVAAGAVTKHSRDFDLTRECVLASGLALETPGVDLTRPVERALTSLIQCTSPESSALTRAASSGMPKSSTSSR